MKHYFISVLLSVFIFFGSSSAQTKVKGTIKNESDQPISGAAILNKTNSAKANSNVKGEFEIDAGINDIINVASIGFESSKVTVSDVSKTLEIKLKEQKTELHDVVVSSNVSPKSYWLGATLAYNIDGGEVDNVVGSAKIGINPVRGKYLGAEWAIVGNFANFISAQNKEKTEKDLLKVAQSSQGLSIGFGGTWEVIPRGDDFNFRCYFTSGYRLNAFQKVVKGADTLSVSLSQFRNTFGIEFEGFQFKQGGKLHFSAEGSVSAFDGDKYELVFGEKKSSLTNAEVTAILPIASNIGFLASGTYSKHFKPVYQFGIIFKDLK